MMPTRPLQTVALLTIAALFLTFGAASAQGVESQSTPTPPSFPPPTVEGRVIDDVNANGVLDPGESGLAGVLVTDGTTVVRTDSRGCYRFARPLSARFVQIRVPAGRVTKNFFRELKVLDAGEIAADVADFFLAPDASRFADDAPTVAHLVDLRPAGMPEAVADARLKAVLQHVSRLKPQPRLLVIAGGPNGLQARAKLVQDMAQTLPPVHHVFLGASNESAGRAEESFFEKTIGPTHYSFECARSLCVVGIDPVEETLRLLAPTGQKTTDNTFLFCGSVVERLSAETPTRMFRTPNLQDDELPGRYRLAWEDGTTRMVLPLEEPLFRWVYPVSGGKVDVSRLELLATAYDSTDAGRQPEHAGETWRFAHLTGSPGAMELDEIPVQEWTLNGWLRRSLPKAGPPLAPGLCVCQVSGLPGLPTPSHTVSFEAVAGPLPSCDLSTPWFGPGGNDLHTATATVTLIPPLTLAGWARFDGPPLLVMEGEVLVPGDQIADAFRWTEPRREILRLPGDTGSSRGGPPVMNDEVICWVNDAGELLWIPTANGPQPEAANQSLKRLKIAPELGQACRRLSPAVVGNVALVVLPQGEAVAVDLEAQRELWRTPVQERCLTPVGMEEGFVLGNVCLSVRSGKPVWKTDGPPFAVDHVGVLGKRIVVTGLVDEGKPGKLTETVACFLMHTGKQVWRLRLAEVDAWQDLRIPGPAFGAGRAFIGSSTGVLHAIDLESGDVDWKVKTGVSLFKLPSAFGDPAARITSRPVFSDRIVYFAGYDGVVHGCDAGRRGKELFRFDLGMPVTDDLVISGNSLLVPTCDGLVFWFVPAATVPDIPE